MRLLIILLLFQFCQGDIFAQPDKEVYRQLILDFVLKHKQPNLEDKTTVYVLKRLKYYDLKLEKCDYEHYKKRFNKLDNSTFDDFVNKAKVDLKFDIDPIDKLEIIYVDKSKDINAKDSTKKSYPVLFEISNIGFNTTNKEALVYFGWQGGYMYGGGTIVLYRKKRTHWKVVKTIGVWAS
jgi:hypothetical protein